MPSPLPELRTLEAIRLRHRWSFRELADAMAAAHVPMHPRTLHYLIKGPGAHGRPQDRHVYAITTYVEHVKEMARRQRVRKLNAAAKKPIGPVNGRVV